MGKTLDDFLAELQGTVDTRVEQEFGPVILERWRDPAHFRALEEVAALAAPDTAANGILFAVRQEDGVVAEALYYTERCGAQAACCETAALLAKGRSRRGGGAPDGQGYPGRRGRPAPGQVAIRLAGGRGL